MENLIVCAILYIVIVAIAYSPKSTVMVHPVLPINYFPEPITESTDIIPSQPAIVLSPNKSSSFATIYSAQPDPAQSFSLANPNLSALGIRDLYALAKGNIKGYKKLSKAALIEALTHHHHGTGKGTKNR